MSGPIPATIDNFAALDPMRMARQLSRAMDAPPGTGTTPPSGDQTIDGDVTINGNLTVTGKLMVGGVDVIAALRSR